MRDALETEATAAAFGAPAPQKAPAPVGTRASEGWMVQVAVAGTTRQRRSLVHNPLCPTEILEWFAEHDHDSQVWVPAARRVEPGRWGAFDAGTAAADTATAPEVLGRLAKDPSRPIRAAVAANPSTDVGTVVMLADDSTYLVRVAVASNPVCPLGVLMSLASDEVPNVRRSVAAQHRCPPEILGRLAQDRNERVRVAVARNKNTDPAVLQVLAKDPVSDVRHGTTVNPSCPP